VRTSCVGVAIALAGCWVDAQPRVETAPPPRKPPIVVAPRPQRAIWRGYYTCAQGVTALELTIVTRGGDATAVFSFGPIDANPTVPHGSYSMVGTARDDGGKLAYQLEPDAWIEQPTGYIMVGLHAASADRVHLHGRVDHASCGALEATLAK
jgi:hypothetical protein